MDGTQCRPTKPRPDSTMTKEELLQVIDQASQNEATRLNLSIKGLPALPPEIGKLTKLEELYLHSAGLAELPREIGELMNLRVLDLNNNQLTALPPEIGQLTKLTTLDLRGNPLSTPPEILEQYDKPAEIIAYYLQHLQAEAAKKRPLNEAKVLFVGDGGVGKSSLVQRLLYDTLEPETIATEGIDIHQWSFQVDDTTIRLNVWDFGGQEIMHATHHLFYSRRSLYIIVLDARRGEQGDRVLHWLKVIQSFGGDSPIIVVRNKIGRQRLDFDQGELRSRYPTIKAIVETSCDTGEGLEKLKTIITREVSGLEHIRDELLSTWFAVKAKLDKMEPDYISYREYQQMCKAEGITDEISQRTLIAFLHDLGTVLHFRDHPLLEDTNVFNPKWVIRGIYQILNSHLLFLRKGVLDRDELDRILDSETHPREKHPFILDLMRKLELCFDFPDAPGKRFLFPDMLPSSEPYTGEWDDSLAFQYHYLVFPGRVISRFIVRMLPYISKKTYWRQGVVLVSEDGQNKALVRADRMDREIFIHVKGREHTRHTFLEIIRAEFRKIHKTYTTLELKEFISTPDRPENLINYQDWLEMQPAVLAASRLEESAPTPSANTAPPMTTKKPGPWKTGFFYLIAFVVIVAVLSVASIWVPWYALAIVFIAALLGIFVVGALQLKYDEGLTDASFDTLMIEFFKRLPLLKGGGTPGALPGTKDEPAQVEPPDLPTG